jgi:DNA-binding NarL/FixJ family response regulator
MSICGGYKVAIVDDHEIVRAALCELVRSLRSGIETTPFSTGRGICEEPVGCYSAIVVDLDLPDIPGALVLRRLRMNQPSLKLIAITGSSDPDMIRLALEAGAITCLSTSTGLDDLRVYLQAAMLGAVIIDPHTQALVSGKQQSNRPGLGNNSLTRRELEVFELLAGGSTLKSIADILFIGEATVRTHRYHIYNKLRIKSRLEATRAYRSLIADPGMSVLVSTN